MTWAAAFLLQMLAYRPVLEPLPLADVWMVLAVPLALAVAAVYKATKLRDLAQLPRQVLRLTVQILIFMVAAAAILKWLTDWI